MENHSSFPTSMVRAALAGKTPFLYHRSPRYSNNLKSEREAFIDYLPWPFLHRVKLKSTLTSKKGTRGLSLTGE
jgi:hypothetical protein